VTRHNTNLGALLLSKLGSRLRKFANAEPITAPRRPTMPPSVTTPRPRAPSIYTPADLHEPPPPHAVQLRETARRHAALIEAVKRAPMFDITRGPKPL
jgi:hypothetical protein